VADVVGPGGTAVSLAGEGAVLVCSLGSPVSAEGGGGVRTEVTALGANGLDQHEILVLALKGVDLYGLEEVVLGVGHDDSGCGTEVTGEVANGHRSTVDLAVVASEEEIHVLAVTDDSLVDRSGVRSSDLSGEKGLCRSPSVHVGGIGRGAVGEGGRSPLVRKNPDLLGCKVEDCWCNGVEALLVLGSSRQLREAADCAKVHRAIVLAVVHGTVDELLAIVAGDGEVLEGRPAVLGLCQGIGCGPAVGCGKVALRCTNCGEAEQPEAGCEDVGHHDVDWDVCCGGCGVGVGDVQWCGRSQGAETLALYTDVNLTQLVELPATRVPGTHRYRTHWTRLAIASCLIQTLLQRTTGSTNSNYRKDYISPNAENPCDSWSA
jgi:hypothetical protein